MKPEFLSNHTAMKILKNEGDYTPEELEQQASELAERAREVRERKTRERQAQLERDRAIDMDTLATTKDRLKELDAVMNVAGKLSLEEAKQLARERQILLDGIREIETKYDLGKEPAPVVENDPQPTANAAWVTTLKIVALLLLCWGIVLYSGDWILGKYPQAAVYNEVSFQKILFGFSVFIGGFVSVIIALNVFFPGFGRYFNPFNHSELDFYEDFKELTQWQRNLIALALFGFLLVCFVLVAAGKLD
ncbi:hypothetical protein [Runella zeae]|uniref:hypothetical protein n=1 Tax=Runella zeae TaxID=94255 RepID=UPI00235322EB|nr:hypothetical protein [Runella zeae]